MRQEHCLITFFTELLVVISASAIQTKNDNRHIVKQQILEKAHHYTITSELVL